MTLDTLVEETKRRAATIEHAWDHRALEWPLTRKSVVVEIGGYIGRWALQIAERYGCRLYVFEPQPWAAAVCRAALGDRATVLDYGLGVADTTGLMGAWETDGCSLVKDGDAAVDLREIGRAFRRLKLTAIDLMLINIEGYEYTLIPHMLDRGIRPRRLMVQWHPFTAEQAQIGATLEQRLTDLGYALVWSYGVILMAWERL